MILEILGFIFLMLQRNNIVEVLEKKTETVTEPGARLVTSGGAALATDLGAVLKTNDKVIETRINLSKKFVFSLGLVIIGLILQHTELNNLVWNNFPQI